ncbi:hypothetical protein P8452_70828 [Trifolium repens]|nr:hypothetical protein P8452_70828 [Trifolium repens]
MDTKTFGDSKPFQKDEVKNALLIHRHMGDASGPLQSELAHDFKYHVAALARERISILIDEWDKVGSDDRNEIWKGLKELWDIPKNDAVEKKTMVYAETWKAFVKSREEPSFLEKRKRGQKAQSYYKYPHRLSQGGYALLEKNMMADRLKERQQAAGGSERPDKKIYEILDTALATYNKLQRARKQKKVDWLFPTSQKQKASYECGYFIMIHMLNIVSATLVGSWTQIFGDSKPFQKDEVKNVQERCGNIILEHIEASTDNDMN